MEEFELLLCKCIDSIERFVKYRIPSSFNADDVLQEVYIAAHEKFDTLKDKAMFKAWIIGIARHKCNDYFRKQARIMEIPIDEVNEHALEYGRVGITETSTVRETLSVLANQDKEILYLYFFREFSQPEIANKLGIPLGTVKSRLHTAKAKFKEIYPYLPKSKGVSIMKKLPEIMPDYSITKSDKEPFAVRHEELPGMMIIPKIGEKIQYGMYSFPQKRMDGIYSLEVTGQITIHGINGVEISTAYKEDNKIQEKRKIWAQLTDNHCRYLGGITTDSNGSQRVITFLDGEAFSDAYAIGENNCGFDVERVPKKYITEAASALYTTSNEDISDIVGRFVIKINEKLYDTVRLIDIQYSMGGQMLCEYYLDNSGRTVLWRRFNSDSWAYNRYKQKWSEKLPDNERLTVNDETYVHWYDCITDYFF